MEEEQAYKRLTQHHMREPTLAVLLCRNDPALAQAVGLAKYLSETPLIEVGTELQVCDLTTSIIAEVYGVTVSKSATFIRRENALQQSNAVSFLQLFWPW